MTQLWSVLLFVISANLDNIVIGIAYGIAGIRMKIGSNLLIALLTTAGTLLSVFAGRLLMQVLSPALTQRLGAGVLVVMGAVFLLQSVLHRVRQSRKKQTVALRDAEQMLEYAEQSDRDVSGCIDPKEAAAVGLGLTLNNLGTGLAAGVSGIPVLPAAPINFAASFSFLLLGFLLGNRCLGKILGAAAPYLSGLLLIILGIAQWLF